jgi:AraC-like DNA-binding protein
VSRPQVTSPVPGCTVGEGPSVRAGLSQLLFSDGGVGIGMTRLAVDNAQWSAAMTIGDDHHVVYSYSPLSVSFEGAGCHVVTPNEAVYQPPGQIYRRTKLYRGEELSVFAAVGPAVTHLVGLGQLSSRALLRVTGLPAEVSMEVWRLAHELLSQLPAHRLDLEYAERAAALVAATVGASAAQDSLARPVSTLTSKSHRNLVDSAREHLAASYADQTLPLARLAADVGASPYHLSRVFRAVTGHSIHQYRMQLRLRAVLAGLATGQPITDLAMSCGFASPSHLSELFRRCFKIPPSQLQNQLLDGRPAAGRMAIRHAGERSGTTTPRTPP